MGSFHATQILVWIENIRNPIGAEIGVFRGRTSRTLLATRGALTLYMVDSWATTPADAAYARSGDFHSKLSQDEQDAHFEAAKQNVAFAHKRAIILRAPSLLAAATIADASLDFAFIDADHSYEGCKADINAWWPKIKKGGFLSGHDYENPDYPLFGVKRAVDEFSSKVELGMGLTWRVCNAYAICK